MVKRCLGGISLHLRNSLFPELKRVKWTRTIPHSSKNKCRLQYCLIRSRLSMGNFITYSLTYNVSNQARQYYLNLYAFSEQKYDLLAVFSWLTSIYWSTDIIYRPIGPVRSQLIQDSARIMDLRDPFISWRDSPVCNAAKAWGVAAGRGSQSVCWWRAVWGAVRRGDREACTRPVSVLVPQKCPELSAERILMEPSPPRSPPLLFSLVPCSIAPGWARLGRTRGSAWLGNWSPAKTGRCCTGSVY